MPAGRIKWSRGPDPARGPYVALEGTLDTMMLGPRRKHLNMTQSIDVAFALGLLLAMPLRTPPEKANVSRIFISSINRTTFFC